MPSINVSEEDFAVVASAARDAKKHGEKEKAAKLDKIARKINAALSNQTLSGLRRMGFGGTKGLTWRDVPSTLL